MKQAAKYAWGSACILYALSVISALLLGMWDWWVALVAVLGLATFGIWKRVSRTQGQDQ